MGNSQGISNEQMSAETLRLAYCRAKEMADFKAGFLMRTAHELRSPLNKIISLQQMIVEGLCDDIDEEREFVAEAYAASMKLLEYLDFLIRVSKIEMGRIVPQPQSVALAPIFQQVEEMTALQIADRNLRLKVKPPEPTLCVNADPTWLCNLLTTLIEVAVDSGDRGNLFLSVSPPSSPEECHLWLETDGQSMAWQEPISLPQSHDFRLEDTLSASLRMSLAEAMVMAQGGRLTILSATEQAEPVTRLQIALPSDRDRLIQ